MDPALKQSSPEAMPVQYGRRRCGDGVKIYSFTSRRLVLKSELYTYRTVQRHDERGVACGPLFRDEEHSVLTLYEQAQASVPVVKRLASRRWQHGFFDARIVQEQSFLGVEDDARQVIEMFCRVLRYGTARRLRNGSRGPEDACGDDDVDQRASDPAG